MRWSFFTPVQTLLRMGFMPTDDEEMQAQKSVAVYSSVFILVVLGLYIFYTSVISTDSPYKIPNISFCVVIVGGILVLLGIYVWKKTHLPLRFIFCIGAISFPILYSLTHGCNSLLYESGTIFMFIVPSTAVFLLAGGTNRTTFVIIFTHLVIFIITHAIEYIHNGGDLSNGKSVGCPTYRKSITSVGSHMFGNAALIIVGIASSLMCLMLFKYAVDQKNARLEGSLYLATQLAAAISDMNLDLARQYWQEEENPGPLDHALMDIVIKLEGFRPYIPDSVFSQGSAVVDNSPRNSRDIGEIQPTGHPVMVMPPQQHKNNSSKESYQGDSSTVIQNIQQQRANLQTGFFHRQVSVMMVEVENFQRRVDESAKRLNDLQIYVEKFMGVALGVIKSCCGVVIRFEGPRICVCWNGSSRQGSHASLALDCAIKVKSALNEQMPQTSVYIALVSENLVVGNAGTQSLKQFMCMGQAMIKLNNLVTLAKRLRVPIVCPETMKVQYGTMYKMRGVDVVRFNDKIICVYEVLGNMDAGEDDEWMYQLEKANKNNKTENTYNTAFKSYVEGQYEEAVIGFTDTCTKNPQDIQSKRLMSLCKQECTRRSKDNNKYIVVRDITDCVHNFESEIKCNELIKELYYDVNYKRQTNSL